MTTTATHIHPFEAAGLGLAPFAYVGMTECVFVACQGADPKPGWTCAYCQTGIRYVFHVRSSDGKVSGVGCECIRKIGDKKLIKAAETDEKKHQKATKVARETTRIEAAKSMLPVARKVLAFQPHPNKFRAANGATMVDYCDWMMKNAGTTGKLAACRIIEAAVKS